MTSAFQRGDGSVFQRRPSSDNFRRSWYQRVVRAVSQRAISLFDAVLRTISRIHRATFQRFTRSVIRPLARKLEERRLAAEEHRNREARVSRYSRLVGALHRSVHQMGQRLEQSSLVRLILAPVRHLRHVIGFLTIGLHSIFEALARYLEQSRWLRWLYFLLLAIQMLASATYEFFRKWFYSRNYRQLIGAIPALLLLAPLAYFMIRIPFQSPVAKARMYQAAATEAWKQEDYAQVRLYHRKIQQLGVAADSTQFESAMVSAAEGDYQTAYSSMQKLVTEYDSVPAHLWIAQSLLEGKLNVPEEAAIQTSSGHIERLLALNPDNIPALTLMAAVQYKQQDVAGAISTLQPIAGKHPPASVALAQYYQAAGNYVAARRSCQNVIAHYETQQSQRKELAGVDYLAWAGAYLLLGNIEAMSEIIEVGLQHHGKDQRFVSSVVDQYAQIVQSEANNPMLTAKQRLALTERAYELTPDNPSVLKTLAKLTDDPGVGAQASALLKVRVEQDDLTPAAHLVLGKIAYRRHDDAAARRHYEAMHRMRPRDSRIMNNLAWLLGTTSPVDLNRALELANQAIELDPYSASNRDTRGRILAKMGHWPEAAADLELAVNGLPYEPGIHDTLATVYENLGRPELADAHRRLESAAAEGSQVP